MPSFFAFWTAAGSLLTASLGIASIWTDQEPASTHTAQTFYLSGGVTVALFLVLVLAIWLEER